MVCPMRFVLVGFSVVVATLGIFMYNERSSPAFKNDGETKNCGQKKDSKSMLQLILNVINGQFLYKETERAREQGGVTYFVFLGVITVLSLLTMLYVVLPYFVDYSVLSGFCPHRYIPYAHELKNGYKEFVKIITG